MGAEKGSAFLLKVGNGGTPVVYTTVAGLRTTQLSVNGSGAGGFRLPVDAACESRRRGLLDCRRRPHGKLEREGGNDRLLERRGMALRFAKGRNGCLGGRGTSRLPA